MLKMLSRLFGSQRHAIALGSDQNRVVIIHNHLFKNAGSTVDWALKKNFGRGFVDHRDDVSMRKGAEYLAPYINEHPYIHAVSSHHLKLPLPELEDTLLFHLMMFRHPIERVSSVYNYERKQVNSSTPGSIHARKLNLKDYILWRMEPGVGYTIRNFHIVHSISPRKANRKPVSEEELQMAVKAVKATPLLGLVERFDESMVLFEETLRCYFPSIDLSYKIQNINQDKKVSREERIAKLRSEVGDETFQLLLDENEKDLKLYECVLEEFHKRIMNTPDMSSKLKDFQARCADKY